MSKAQSSRSTKRIWIFRLVLITLPFAILLAFEGLLRLAGYGKEVPLFITNPQAPEYRLPKPDVVSRFFADPKAGPNVTIETNFFLAEKPAQGLRLIVQGGSTAAGFPYGFGASIAGMLDYRLKQAYPNREVEVINTALSAVNSYTLLDFADEIIEQNPDAVLIYAGHNEYLGIMGVGSTYSKFSSRAANLLFLKLKNVRIFQLMQNLWLGLQGQPEQALEQEQRQSRTVMSQVAKHKQIDINAPLFSAGLEQFEGNMSLLLAKYKAAGIPVFLSTIASNLADQAPFESHPIDSEHQALLAMPPEELTGFQVSVLALEAQKHQSAETYFVLAKHYQSQQDYAQARRMFDLAKQHDLLRFRAPREMNQIIRRLAVDENVTLVDAEASLVAAAPNGLIDNSLMLEHLHPNVKGYFEIANAFYDQIADSPLLPEPEIEVSKFSAMLDVPLFASEMVKGQATIASLMADYPFRDEPTEPQMPAVKTERDKLGLAYFNKRASWLDIAQFELAEATSKQDLKMTMRASKLLSDAIPNNPEFAFKAGTSLIAAKKSAQAFRYLKRVLRHKPNDVNAQLALAHASIEVKDYKQAEKWLLEVKAIQPDNPVVQQNLSRLQAFIRNQ